MMGRMMSGGHSEAAAADIRAVIEGRGLGPSDGAWLARAATGAVRPNRDRPWWDLAHALAALPPGGEGPLALLLDPSLGTPRAVAARLGDAPGADAMGLTLGAEWRIGWSGLARALALFEFVATTDECARFAEAAALADDLGAGAVAPADGARALSRWAAEWRNAHLALAPVERRFRAVLGHLRALGRHGAQFHDDDILAYWETEARGGETTLFVTAAEHFGTFERAHRELGEASAVAGAASLEETEDWADRLDAVAAVPVDERGPALAALETVPDAPKMLTGAERERAIRLLRLDPFHRTRPRTVLRAASFGLVQSGIANRLRRGSGGPDVAARVRCEDAESYDAILARAEALRDHMGRVLRIALALRAGKADGTMADVAAEGERELSRLRRTGFDAPREALAAAFTGAEDALVRLNEELTAFAAAAATTELDAAHEADRERFADALAAIYLSPPARVPANDTGALHA